MKHLRPRAGVVLHAAPFFLILAFTTQAALCNCGAAVAQSDSKAKREAQARQQKIANPLNDLLDEAQRDIDANDFEAAVEIGRAHV